MTLEGLVSTIPPIPPTIRWVPGGFIMCDVQGPYAIGVERSLVYRLQKEFSIDGVSLNKAIYVALHDHDLTTIDTLVPLITNAVVVNPKRYAT